jgi:hypothetical protein
LCLLADQAFVRRVEAFQEVGKERELNVVVAVHDLRGRGGQRREQSRRLGLVLPRSAYPAELQPVTPNVVLVNGSGAVLFPGESDQGVPPNGLITMVAARDAGSWRFVSFSNTPTGRARNARFLWRYLASRLSIFRAEARKARAHMLAEKQQNMYFAGRTARLGIRGGYPAAKRGTKSHEEDHPR